MISNDHPEDHFIPSLLPRLVVRSRFYKNVLLPLKSPVDLASVCGLTTPARHSATKASMCFELPLR